MNNKKHIIMKKNKSIIFSIAAFFLFFACKNDANDPFADFNPYDTDLGKRIQAYNNTKNPNLANEKSGNPGLYIDFSSGINQAFKKADIKENVIGCYNLLINDKPDVYGLGSQKTMLIENLDATELGQLIDNPLTYKDIFAPIQNAVEQIVDKNNDALLITDFEEWQNNTQVTAPAFLAPSFSKWLAKGNTIHFFIADYIEDKVSKHIYFTIFNCGNPNESSMISKLQTKLSSLTRYDLTNKSYKLTQQYPSGKAGGIFYDETGKTDKEKNILDLKENYINGLKNGNPFEFYPFGLDWNTIDATHSSYKSQNQFNDFFRKLYIDLQDENAYVYGDFDVKVYDVTNDFLHFAKCNEVKNHQPKLEKGSNGEDKFKDGEEDPVILSCYDTKGKVKDEWIYKSQENAPNILTEVFVLNKELFKNTKASDKKKVEFGVSFDTKYNLKNITNPDGLIRVDIVLNSAEPNLSNPILENFKWVNSKSVPNVALYESIKTTLQEVGVKPSNKVIYSYYIKTLQ